MTKPGHPKLRGNPAKSSTSASKSPKQESKTGSKKKSKSVIKNGCQGTLIRKPFKPDEVSSNWKNLLQTIKPPRTGSLPAYRKKKLVSQASDPVTKPKIDQTVTTQESKSEQIWFDNVDPILLDVCTSTDSDQQLIQSNQSKGITKFLALDCEMVGVGADGSESALARVSIVNQYGHCVYDKYVLPGEEVTDYRTKFSGIRPQNLKNAIHLGIARHEVSEILRGCILVGHALKHDLQVLMIKHPKSNIRDTSKYKPFRKLVNGSTPSLKLLASVHLGVDIQTGEHCSVQDAQAAMRLYAMFREKWESELTVLRQERKSKLTKGKMIKSKKSQSVHDQTEES